MMWLSVGLFLFFGLVRLEKQDAQDYGPYVIGIDLGTTYSCVGVFQNGRVNILQNEQGNRITPSYVAFTTEGERLIGDSAKSQLTSNPENTIFDAKRLIGRQFSDKNIQNDMKYWPFKVVNKNGRPFVEVTVSGAKKQFSPEEISGMVLGKMKQIAEKALDVNITHAVITVPAYFNDAQRAATKDAGKIAGLEVLRIINEPTAAAIAYGFNKQEGEKNILVFDLGGGTFDVSALTIEDGVFEVLATDGDTHLGGQDFDNKLTNYILNEIKKSKNVDLSKSKRSIQKIKREAEKAKRSLSRYHKAELDFEDLSGDGSLSIKLIVSRAKFEELNSELFRSTLIPLDKVIKDAKLQKNQIHEVVLVGGSTRIPKIQQLVKEYFGGKEPNKGINPDEAVAFGAAIQGAILKGDEETSNLVLLDVNPLSLGIETQGGVATFIIPRNTPIPVSRTKTFSTVQDGQTVVEIRISEGERQVFSQNNLLGNFKLLGIHPAPRGEPQIDVTFKLTADGILIVTAEEKKSGSKEQIQISQDKTRPSQEDIDRMIKEAEMYKSEDDAFKERVEKRNMFEGTVYSLKNKASDKEKVGDKLSESEQQELISLCDEAVSWLEGNAEASVEELSNKHQEFDEKTKELAQKLLGTPGEQTGQQDDSQEYDQHEEL